MLHDKRDGFYDDCCEICCNQAAATELYNVVSRDVIKRLLHPQQKQIPHNSRRTSRNITELFPHLCSRWAENAGNAQLSPSKVKKRQLAFSIYAFTIQKHKMGWKLYFHDDRKLKVTWRVRKRAEGFWNNFVRHWNGCADVVNVSAGHSMTSAESIFVTANEELVCEASEFKEITYGCDYQCFQSRSLTREDFELNKHKPLSNLHNVTQCFNLLLLIAMLNTLNSVKFYHSISTWMNSA